MATTTSSPGLSGFWRDLPREGRMMLSIVVLEFLGTGLVLPFHVVYLHEVRDFALSDVGLLLGLPPLMGLLVVGPGGSAIDRIGARRIQIGVLLLLVGGNALLAFATSRTIAAVALSIIGIAFGMSWPAWQSVVASVIPSQLRQRYFGVNFTLLNLGIGIGGVVGGLFVDVSDTRTFQTIYLADSVSYIPALLLLLGPLRHIAGKVEVTHDDAAAPMGYLAVLRSPAMATLTVLSFVSSFVGYSQLNAGMPAYARGVGEVSTRGLGLAFAANTLVIVLLQLVVLQRIEGRRRTRVIAVMSLVWASSWVCLGLSGLVPGTWGATLLVAGCASIFAFGETLLQPTIPALVNDLAPDHLRGRYNAVSSGSFQLAAVIAPPIAGVLIGHALGDVYIGLLVVGCLVCGLVAIARLEPQLDPSVNGVRDDETASDGELTPPVVSPVD
ncbi:MFS transporter [Nocardioides halotolerans]|jgi:MFS family permease|uniref:MFS transporter n=1 Tax=Nocardioides halotolerans TaxID=433660 RepID=UPI00040916CD|nr:MFS transporter [Nocardioides halotolerans]